MWTKGNVRIIKECEVWRRIWIIGLISSFILRCYQLRLTSGPSFQNTTIVHTRGSNAVLKKLNWDTGQTLTPIGLERVFKRSTQAVHSPLAAKMPKLPFRVPWGLIQHWKCTFGKNDVEGLPKEGNISCKCRWIPAKDQLFPWAQRLAFVNGILNICNHIFL